MNYEGRLGEVALTFQLYLPLSALLAIPLFSFLLKLMFRRRFYIEHLVFTFHLFTFLFLADAILTLPEFLFTVEIGWLFALILPAYLFFALRAVYRGRAGFIVFATLASTIVLFILAGSMLLGVGALAVTLT